MDKYKKKSFKFDSRYSGTVRQLEVENHRKSVRHERLSYLRNINDTCFEDEKSITAESEKKVDKPVSEMPRNKPLSRLELLKKWQAEKQLKKQLEAKLKKPAFKIGAVIQDKYPLVLPADRNSTSIKDNSKTVSYYKEKTVSKILQTKNQASGLHNKRNPTDKHILSIPPSSHRNITCRVPTNKYAAAIPVNKVVTAARIPVTRAACGIQIKKSAVGIPTNRTNSYGRAVPNGKSASEKPFNKLAPGKPTNNCTQRTLASKSTSETSAKKGVLGLAANKFTHQKNPEAKGSSSVISKSLKNESEKYIQNGIDQEKTSENLMKFSQKEVDNIESPICEDKSYDKSFAPKNFQFCPLNLLGPDFEDPVAMFERIKAAHRNRISTPRFQFSLQQEKENDTAEPEQKEADVGTPSRFQEKKSPRNLISKFNDDSSSENGLPVANNLKPKPSELKTKNLLDDVSIEHFTSRTHDKQALDTISENCESDFTAQPIYEVWRKKPLLSELVSPRRSLRLARRSQNELPGDAVVYDSSEDKVASSHKTNITSDFECLSLESDKENEDLNIICIDNTPHKSKNHISILNSQHPTSSRVSLLYTPEERRKSLRKSIRQDLITFT